MLSYFTIAAVLYVTQTDGIGYVLVVGCGPSRSEDKSGKLKVTNGHEAMLKCLVIGIKNQL